MKFLLATDTHGHLEILNELAEHHAADAVIHAGDFGFYDEESIDRLSAREVMLRIWHSDLNKEAKQDLKRQTDTERRRFVREQLPMSDLPAFLSGERKFHTPVYAVWGNHEDTKVVKKFYTGEYAVNNLHLLHEKTSFHVGQIHLFGLGGNFLVGNKLFQTPIAGGGGKLWSVLDQYAQLLKTVEANARAGEQRIMVSHVSPGKEPFMTLMGLQCSAGLIVSGHMDPPFPMMWTDFAVRSVEEAVQRVKDRISDIEQACATLKSSEREKYEEIIVRLAELPSPSVDIGGGRKVPPWYRNMYTVNLPNADKGAALLDTNGESWTVYTAQNG